MTRKKVKLAWIVNDNARKASLKKRRVGLMKKVSELTTLCDVRACVIIFSPDEAEPVVWPSPELARGLVERFFALPEIERSKKAMNQESYLKERTGKVHDQLTKSQRKNKEDEMDHLMGQLHRGRKLDELCLNEMYGLIWYSREKITEYRKRIEFIQHVPLRDPPQQNPLAVEEAAAAATAQMATGGEGRVGVNNQLVENQNQYLMDQWFFNTVGNNNNNSNSGNNNNNDHNLEALVAGNPSAPHQFGLMPYGNLSYGNFTYMGPSLQYGNFLGEQGSENPNMEGLLPSHPHGSFRDMLALGLQPHHHENMNINILNEGNMNIGVHMGLGLQPHGGEGDQILMGKELRLQPHGVIGRELGLLPHGGGGRGEGMVADRAQPYGGGEGSSIMSTELVLPPRGAGGGLMGSDLRLQHHGQRGGGGSGLPGGGLGLQPQGGAGGSVAGSELGLPFELFGGGSSGGSDMGLPYDISKTWASNNKFSP